MTTEERKIGLMGIKFPWEVAFARSKGMKEKSLMWLALALPGR